MIYLLLSLIVIVNLSPFLVPAIDIWHATGMGVQAMILLMFSWSFFERPKYQSIQNKPLAFLHLWIAGFTAFICFKSQIALGKYDIHHFFPYFNFLCILMLYKMIVQYIDIKDIRKVYLFLRYSIIATLLLSTLQVFERAQFFALLHPGYQDGTYYNNFVTGVIGNGTHLSGFLAMCAPLFFKKNREDILALILLVILLIFHTGQNIGEPAVSGWVVFCGCLLFYVFNKNKNIFWPVVLLGLAGACLVFTKVNPRILADNGRFEWWQLFWKSSKEMFITGFGLGSINLTALEFKTPRHLHMEYLQFLVELGVIGLAGIVWLIKDFFERGVSKESLIFKTMFVGFLISSFFTYPAHLWIPSTYACIAYSCFMVLNEREIYAGCH